MKSLWIAIMFTIVAIDGVVAQPVYRCGADGRTYSHTPCPEGRVIDASDPRSDAQRNEARGRAATEQRETAEMARERRLQEASVKRSVDKPPPRSTKTGKGQGKLRTIQVKPEPATKADSKR